ncbi:hypothetical protein PLEOSDRAFT_159859 [Pleurotus ostreatus PC15]|uniref:Uncharacterized protein n=1 Tax=Pleurotus ostreatus (strain PC15) TaxID=1137138 RepID=A0A067NAY6_PLEO1|nr:hypothetical protein PLEOSDRAFT_159859 [Pleurotus ostreatus PC15]
MPLSAAQQQALQDAHKLLSDAGITTGLLDDIAAPPPSEPSVDSGFLALAYQPTEAIPFSASEISRSMHHLNRQTILTHIVEHPLGAIVEYPQTTANDHEAIVHWFVIDAQCFTHPKGNFQYSLGDSHGGHDNIKCGTLLIDKQGRPVPCNHLRTSCEHMAKLD